MSRKIIYLKTPNYSSFEVRGFVVLSFDLHSGTTLIELGVYILT